MAIRDRANRICILAHEEGFYFASTGELPRHATHPHCGRHLADQMTSTVLFVAEGRNIYEASWIGKGRRAIILHDLRQWQKVNSNGCAVMQLVRG